MRILQMPIYQQAVGMGALVDARHGAIVVWIVDVRFCPEAVNIQRRIGDPEWIEGPADMCDAAREAPVTLVPFQGKTQAKPQSRQPKQPRHANNNVKPDTSDSDQYEAT